MDNADASEKNDPFGALPNAVLRRRRWNFSFVWIVPVVAAMVAGYLVYDRFQEFGPTISIKFREGSGVKAGQTEIRYRGVTIGEVTSIELSEDQQYVIVRARLLQSAASIATEGSRFWIVRPELGIGSISSLSTVISGSFIQVAPGTGAAKSEFVGLDRPPRVLERALRIIVSAVNLGSVRPGSPVYYRGIEVGSVIDTVLSSDATAAHIHVFVNQRYARLVRVGSRFWAVGGVDLDFSLFRGVEINIQSLRSLITGGIAFATPEDSKSPPAKDGTIFLLHDKPQKEWLEWMPTIHIPPPN
jgi:paraquat-inducible protein B